MIGTSELAFGLFGYYENIVNMGPLGTKGDWVHVGRVNIL